MNKNINHLHFLIGNWNTEGIIWDAGKESGSIKGTDCYEWAAGGFYILHRVNVIMDEKKVEVIELIGYDEKNKIFIMYSFDNEGNHMIMHAFSEKDGELKIFNEKMRSTLKAARDGKYMIAKWEQSSDGIHWVKWMDMKFTRV